ncbi:hypothetical protein L286_23300 [Sphingobium sp. HDIP04]|nr:hypothetical protein L286_23300 [Sphingobium sp. HDIP04]
MRMDQATAYAARQLGATPADIPGLWNVPGLPELTTGQLLQIAAQQVCPIDFNDMQPLGGDIERIWDQNLDQLYER